MFKIYSSQTGSQLMPGIVVAETESDALDAFARRYGFTDCRDMWKRGAFEYATAVRVG